LSSTLLLLLPVDSAPGFDSPAPGTRCRWVRRGSPPHNMLSLLSLSPSLPLSLSSSVRWCCVFGSSGCHGSDDVGGGCCVGLVSLGMGWGVGGESDERKMGYDKCRSPLSRRTGWASHSLGPPLCFPSPIPRSSKYVPAHIPLERGGAGAAVVRFAHPRVLIVEPTSLNRGEGLVAKWLRVVSGELWWQGGSKGDSGGGGMRESEPKSTVMQLMTALNSAPPTR